MTLVESEYFAVEQSGAVVSPEKTSSNLSTAHNIVAELCIYTFTPPLLGDSETPESSARSRGKFWGETLAMLVARPARLPVKTRDKKCGKLRKTVRACGGRLRGAKQKSPNACARLEHGCEGVPVWARPEPRATRRHSLPLAAVTWGQGIVPHQQKNTIMNVGDAYTTASTQNLLITVLSNKGIELR